jgi:hypothetical protein
VAALARFYLIATLTTQASTVALRKLFSRSFLSKFHIEELKKSSTLPDRKYDSLLNLVSGYPALIPFPVTKKT